MQLFSNCYQMETSFNFIDAAFFLNFASFQYYIYQKKKW